MKKVFVAVALAVVVFFAGSGVQAQTAVTGSIGAYATVLTALTINDGISGLAGGPASLEFGFVQPGQPKIVSTSSTVTGIPVSGATGPRGAEHAGFFKIGGTASRQIQVTVTAVPANLSDGGTNSLPISFNNGLDAGMGWEYTSTGTATGTAHGPLTAAALTAQTLSAGGEGWFYIGGRVNPGTTQAAGDYSGTISMQVVYTGN